MEGRSARCRGCHPRPAPRANWPAATCVAFLFYFCRRNRGPGFRAVAAPNKFALLSARWHGECKRNAPHACGGALEDCQRCSLVRHWSARQYWGDQDSRERARLFHHAGINPTQCEALTMEAVQVFGNDHAVAFAGSQGNFQVNVYKPVMMHNVLTSIELLADAFRSFSELCAAGIEPNEKRIKEHLDNSLMLVTALNPHIGYEKAAKISLTAYREDISLREAALKLGFLTAEQFDSWVRPQDMTHPLGGSL